MAAWWYVIKDKKLGPVGIDELKTLVQAGNIGSDTMLWSEGMDTWRPLEKIDELGLLTAAVPPPFPPKVETHALDYKLAGRWPRFLARYFDLWLMLLLVTIPLTAILSYYSGAFLEWISRPGAGQLIAIVCTPIALIADAILYALAGNTMGKALLGISVRDAEGKTLGFTAYLRRNFSMWVNGLGLWLPIITLFTMWHQSSRLKKGLPAGYDEAPGYSVRAKPANWLKIIAFIAATIGLVTVVVVLNVMDKDAERKQRQNADLKDYSWENPKTFHNTPISAKWKLSKETLTPGADPVYVFTEITDHAIIIFAAEDMQNVGFSAYIQALKKANGELLFSDGGRFYARDGRDIWEGNGTMASDSTTRLNVQIAQYGSTYWRIVTIQAKPYSFSDKLVDQLRTSLWSTLK